MLRLILISIGFILLSTQTLAADPLPSWNDGPSKKNIIQFVEAVTNKASPDYIAPADRIATIDNDGTLWVEQPIYTQIIFSLQRFKELAAKHPEWMNNPNVKALMAKQPQDYDAKDYETIFTLTSIGISVDEYRAAAQKWLQTAEDPRFKHHYTQLVYQPMLEVLQYLRAHDFIVYIVSGGGQDFIRAFADKTYGVPSERVIGSTLQNQYQYNNGKPELMKSAKVLFISDKTGKPEAIDLFIGKKPVIAFGNSDGDRQMLEWTQSSKNRHLMLLVHHDDAVREYAYDKDSKVGTFSTSLFTEADKNHWQVISMKNDWKIIFPFKQTSPT